MDHLFAQLRAQHSDLRLAHAGSVKNSDIIASLARYDRTHLAEQLGNDGSSRPDGGIITVLCGDGLIRPLFIGENKHQQDNPGNALERSLKNISFFKNWMINEDYFPYLLNINGPIVNEAKGSLFDRIRQDAGFVPSNQVHVVSDPQKPRLRPFTIMIQREFDAQLVTETAAEIVRQSLAHLAKLGLV